MCRASSKFKGIFALLKKRYACSFYLISTLSGFYCGKRFRNASGHNL